MYVEYLTLQQAVKHTKKEFKVPPTYRYGVRLGLLRAPKKMKHQTKA